MRALLPLTFCLLLACSSDADEVTSNSSGLAGKSASAGASGKGGSGGSGGSGQSGNGGSGQSGDGGSSGGVGGSSAGQGGSGTSGQAGSGNGGSNQGAGQGGAGGSGQAGSGQAGSGTAGGEQGGSGGAADPFEGYRQHCVDKINEYRATVGLAPYTRWKEGEACADQMADHDATVKQAHDGFQKGICSPKGNGQNECPGYGSPDALDGCLGQMWAEGPSPNGEWDIPHGHYMNMVGEYTYQGFQVKFTKVTCGFSSKGWFLQNFQ